MDFAGKTFWAMGLVITDVGTHASENATPSSAANGSRSIAPVRGHSGTAWSALNVLLSFPQFDREVTSERIRIGASKRRGLWVGSVLVCHIEHLSIRNTPH
jgi:hypothetical protein